MEKLGLSKRNLRKFALTMAVCFCAVNLIIFLKHRQISKVLLIISSVFLLSGVLIPQYLKIIYIVWMRLAEAIGYVVSRVILSIIFLLILTPVGIILKIIGKDLLDRKMDNSSSYWKEADSKSADYERQF